MTRWVALLIGASLVSGCSGGGGSSALPKTAAPISPSKTKVQVSISLHVPGAASARTSKLKRIFTVAQNTEGAQVAVYPAGNDSGTPLATTAANIEPSISPGSVCAASDSYGNRVCTFNLLAPLGTSDFIITTWDQPPAAGVIPAAAHQLGWGLDPSVAIVAGGSPSVSATLSSVLASVSLDLTPQYLHLLIPSTGTVGVYALDADNDVIVSNGFVDPDGNQITLTINIDNTLNGQLYLSTSSITAPSPTGIQYVYAPSSGVLSETANQTTNFTVTSTYGISTTGASLTSLYPTFNSITDANLSTNNLYHGGMGFNTFIPTSVFYTAPGSSGSFGDLEEYDSGTASVSTVAGTGPQPIRGGIGNQVSGSGPFIVTGSELSSIGYGPLTLNNIAGGEPLPNGSQTVTDTSGGEIYYTSASNLVILNSAGSLLTNLPLSASMTGGLATDPGDDVWIVDNVDNELFEFPFAGEGVNGPYLLQAGGSAFDVTANGNGVFITDHGPNPAILQTDTSGNLLETYSLPGGAIPWYLMNDNAQAGIVWFDYLQNGQIGIGRMDTNVTPATFVMATDTNGPFGSQAGAIGAAPNGLVYMVFDGTSTLVQVTR